MVSTSMATEKSLRLTLKLLQFFVSLYLIFSLYNTGPHWILLIACLAVPVYGIYLMVKSPDRTLRQHPVPFVRYKALARNKNWLRVDVAISLTMACACFGFSAILFFGYFKVSTATSFYLQAAVASFLLCVLYLFNSVLSTRQIEMGTIDFIINNEKQPFTTHLSRTSPLAISTDFGQSEHYFHKGEGVPPNYNMPPHKSTVSSLTLLERLQMELAQRKQQDAPDKKPSVAESSQENHSLHAKSSGLSGLSTDGAHQLSSSQLKYKYSEEFNMNGTHDFNASDLERDIRAKSISEWSNQRKLSEMPVSGRQQQPVEKKHQSTSSSISPYKSSSQPYNRKAVPAPKLGWSVDNRYKHSTTSDQMTSPKRSEAGGEVQQRDGLSSILKKSSASTSPIKIASGDQGESTQNSTTNSSNTSNHYPASSFTQYNFLKNSSERGKNISSEFTTHMPVYSRKFEASEPIKTAVHRAVPVKVRPIEGDRGDPSQSDSSTGDSSAAEFDRNDGKGSSQTVQSSQGSTVRLDDFDQMRFRSLTTANQMKMSGSKVNISADPIPPIASAIDSGREREIQRLGGGTRLREKINIYKNGFDGARPRSMPFRHSTELQIETSLTEMSPTSQVTQF